MLDTLGAGHSPFLRVALELFEYHSLHITEQGTKTYSALSSSACCTCFLLGWLSATVLGERIFGVDRYEFVVRGRHIELYCGFFGKSNVC